MNVGAASIRQRNEAVWEATGLGGVVQAFWLGYAGPKAHPDFDHGQCFEPLL
jgi:hypothetical protein